MYTAWAKTTTPRQSSTFFMAPPCIAGPKDNEPTASDRSAATVSWHTYVAVPMPMLSALGWSCHRSTGKARGTTTFAGETVLQAEDVSDRFAPACGRKR